MAIQKPWSRVVLRKLPLLTITPFLLASCEPPAEGNTLTPTATDKNLVTDVEPTQLFMKHCESCHGMNGDKGVSGAANLKQTMMSDLQMRQIIIYGSGNGTMLPFRDKLNDEEVSALVEYIKMLKYK